jgi:glutamate dehydrogenase (NAD(P)+)
MAWFMDEISSHEGHYSPEITTGKPIILGGSEGRTEATGRGVAIATVALLRKMGMSPEGTRVVVQGFGNVGFYAANILHDEYGCKIVGISDVTIALHNANGLDLPSINAHMERTKVLEGYKGPAEVINNADLLTLPCDVLAPCAIENQITVKNAANVQARLIVEGANGPTTFDADAILKDRGIVVVPDILANAGGVIVSYFEWVQDLQFYFWDVEEVREKLHKKMSTSFEQAWAVKEERGIDMRSAVYLVAVDRVAKALQKRGFGSA